MGKRSEKELTRLRDEVYEAVISPAMIASNRFFNSPRAPRYLVHFTSTETLTKIIQNRTLRLNRIKASNDPMELEHGIKMALAVLDTLRRSPRDGFFKVALQRGFDGKLSDGTKRVVIEPHAICFTQTRKVNAAAHWAMYGRNGSGVALKFRGTALERIANDQNVGLAKVVYDAKRQREILKNLLKFFRASANEAASRQGPTYDPEVGARLFNYATQAYGAIVMGHTATIKGEGFRAEEEWRLVHPGAGKPTGVDAVNHIMRSYYDVTFKPNDLAEVIVGPVLADLNESVIIKLLADCGYARTKVSVGGIPIRTLP
jgi:hypothetical protein